jgi:protein-histidine pros-kinase
MVQSSAKHLLSLINDLLDLAKIDSGNVQMQFKPVACRALVEGVAATLRPTAEAKGLRLLVRLPPQDVSVDSDARALQQIVLNLVSNAVKFTESGTVTVTLDAPDATGVSVSVSDTGPGIGADEQARLFQAFTRVGSATSRSRIEGTGLGLYLSRKLAELLGGRIELDSEYGRGSCFTLHLPAR